MRINRPVLWFLGLALLALPAAAQQIQWTFDLEQAVGVAQRNKLPLMLYVQSGDKDRDNDTETAHNKVFRDPFVIEWTKRFVPVKASRSRYRKQLTDWGVGTANQAVVFVSPQGKLIDQIGPTGVANRESFIEKMHSVFKQHRTNLFNEELRPKLEGKDKISPQELATTLNIIKTFLIVEADSTLVKLLDRSDLDKGSMIKIMDTLADLSTKIATDALLKRAPNDPAAAKALDDCTPEAAERMLTMLDSKDKDEFLLAYHAVTKICKIQPKSDKFWDGTNERIKTDEIDRVKSQVRSTAKNWTLKFGQFR